MSALKILWGLLFLLCLLAYTLIFFGAASGGSNNPRMMYLLWLLVAVGVGCGIFTVVRLYSARQFGLVDGLMAVVALWPLFWIGLAVAKDAFR